MEKSWGMKAMKYKNTAIVVEGGGLRGAYSGLFGKRRCDLFREHDDGKHASRTPHDSAFGPLAC